MRARTVSFATLGCRLNQVDSAQLQTALEARGFRTVPVEAPADVVVVNTCTVTARAEFSDRQAIRRAARVSPGGRLVVTGCWAQTSPGEVAGLAEVDLVVGNADKARLAELIDGLLAGAGARVHVSDIAGARGVEIPPLAHVGARSRAFLKVQDGCQHRCAFCIVPRARGRSRSLEPRVVLDHARRLVEAGHVELTLTGVDLGSYGADLHPRTTLAALLRGLAALPGLRWLRLSSLLPAYFTEDLLETLATSRVIAPHLHVPLQSGSDRVLRRMRRPYTAAMYRRLIERLAAAIPALGLGADVIVGFPGESDADFAETRALVGALPFSYLHVFPFSPRRGTEAAALADRVDGATSGRRGRELRELGRAKGAAFRERLRGSVQEVLVLETRDRGTGGLIGLTGNYVEVVFPGPDGRMRTLARVRVTGVRGERALGEFV
ncbi:MAG: tRNA (N(6)-L-threonylcarbamoyladenosine(37)-C(2))-methylthiotransferase MtaB [Candidatus Rokubacteria bacterium RIFCSPLOWO2_02_FULL_72_37]|nr:MAG: tRNA (N(6)-L-threonylcarbamoyladenosine(37)-C(2))-methylthiotransferase MtaB [Candidatus Rokubacteria bacterium RIFCSPLOWO2_02_FULL_72_37]